MNLENDQDAGRSSDPHVCCCMCMEEYGRKETYVEHMKFVHNVEDAKIEFMYQFSTTVTYDRKGIFWPQGEIVKNRGKKRKSSCVSEGAKRMRVSSHNSPPLLLSGTIQAGYDLHSAEASNDLDHASIPSASDICPSDSASMIGRSTSVTQGDIGGGGQVSQQTLNVRLAGSDTSSIRSLLLPGSGSVSSSTSDSSFNPGSKQTDGVENRDFVLRTQRPQVAQIIRIQNPPHEQYEHDGGYGQDRGGTRDRLRGVARCQDSGRVQARGRGRAQVQAQGRGLARTEYRGQGDRGRIRGRGRGGGGGQGRVGLQDSAVEQGQAQDISDSEGSGITSSSIAPFIGVMDVECELDSADI